MSNKAVSERLIRLGEEVRRQRQYKRMSQEKLAELAGVSTNTISRIEGGQTAMSVEIFQKLVRILELNANMILLEQEQVRGINKFHELYIRFTQLHHRDQRIVTDTIETLIRGLEKPKN